MIIEYTEVIFQCSAAKACLPRSFAPEKGEHPVKWLLEMLAAGPGIRDSLHVWLDQTMPGLVPSPGSAPSNPATDQLMGLGLLDIKYCLPSDGHPALPGWKVVASDIYFTGFDGLREPLEVKEEGDGTYRVVKGLGRFSCILFGCYWTFVKNSEIPADSEILKDFTRSG